MRVKLQKGITESEHKKTQNHHQGVNPLTIEVITFEGYSTNYCPNYCVFTVVGVRLHMSVK